MIRAVFIWLSGFDSLFDHRVRSILYNCDNTIRNSLDMFTVEQCSTLLVWFTQLMRLPCFVFIQAYISGRIFTWFGMDLPTRQFLLFFII